MPSFCRLALPARRSLVFCSFSSHFPGQKQTTNQQKLYWNKGLHFWGGITHSGIYSFKQSLLGPAGWQFRCAGPRVPGESRTVSPGDPADLRGREGGREGGGACHIRCCSPGLESRALAQLQVALLSPEAEIGKGLVLSHLKGPG